MIWTILDAWILLLVFSISGDLPIIISCASLALADAGIMMYDLVTSVSVVWPHVVPLLWDLHLNHQLNLRMIMFYFLVPVLFWKEHHHRSNLRRGSMARWKPHGSFHASPQGDHPTHTHWRVEWRQNHQRMLYLVLYCTNIGVGGTEAVIITDIFVMFINRL